MRMHALTSFWGALVLSLGLMCGNASGLIIYRFGGASLPPPAEAGNRDVEFIQLPWSALDAAQGGETFQLDMDDASIKALQRDPQVNIAPTAIDRGEGPTRVDLYGNAFDEDESTLWYDDGFLCAEVRFAGWCNEGYSFVSTTSINLGGFYVIDRIRVISGLIAPGSTAKRFRIAISQTRQPMGQVLSPLNPFFMEIIDNRDHYREIVFPPHEPVTFLQLAMHEHREPWEFAEIEIYAKGFVDKSSYVSDIIDFGAPAAWGELKWSGFRDLGAKVFLHTRSGADDDPSLYWKFIGRGEDKELVTRSQYSQLKLGQKAGTTYDRDSWTLWSAPYDFADSSGAAVVSLSPRRYLQFKVDFIPWEESGSGLDFLEIRASTPPVASELLGEIFPYEQVEVGEESRFTYILQPTIKADDTGFDRLEMTTFSSRIFSVESVKLDNIEMPFEVEALDEHRFEVSFPKIGQESSRALVEVVFHAQVLRYGSTFNARVFDSSRPLEVPQGVSAGDATDDFDGNTVSVATSIDKRSLLELSVSPRVFTPNGDGVNDSARISYDLFESLGMVSMTIEIRDLAGRLVRQVHAGEDRIGHYEQQWDGKDDAGALVPPGLYLYRASVDTDREQVDRIGTIHVAY